MKKTLILILLIIISFLIVNNGYSNNNNKTKMDKWNIVFTPMYGLVNNIVRFHYDIPTGKNEITPRTREFEDNGYGVGATIVFVMDTFSIVNVSFYVPEVNDSRLFGNVTYISNIFKINETFGLLTGIGMTYHYVKTDFKDFEDTVTKEVAGTQIKATGKFSEFHIRNNVYAPFPRLGLRMNIPIQHWHFTPYLGYLYEALKIKVNSPGGSVYIPEPIDETKNVPSIRSDKWKHYYSFLVGFELFMDFHYAFQLRLKFYYNTNHNKINIRTFGSAFFSRKIPLGMALYLEYAQGNIHDNIYGFIGPSYMF